MLTSSITNIKIEDETEVSGVSLTTGDLNRLYLMFGKGYVILLYDVFIYDL